MARIRTIKPEFWTDEKLTECSVIARLLFIGTWNFADDQGNLDRSPKQIKARVFPVDNIDCEPLLLELIAQGLLIEYSVSGKKYLHVQGFSKHQVINRPSKPQCPKYEESESTPGTLTEPSVTTHNGREGKEGSSTTEKARSPKRELYTDSFESVWKQYPKRSGDNPKGKAFNAWRARLAAGRTVEEMGEGLARYVTHCTAKQIIGTEFVMQASRFFGPDEAFTNDWAVAAKSGYDDAWGRPQ